MSVITEKENTEQIEVENLNPREEDFLNAKAYLLECSAESGLTIYDHLVVLLKKFLEEKPNGALDNFENISAEAKRARFFSSADTVKDTNSLTTETILAEVQRRLFQKKPVSHESFDEEEEESHVLPNVMQTAFFFEQAGIGFSREETFRVWLSLRQLVEKYPLKSCRFWGKLFGIHKNYYIAEVEFQENEDKFGKEEYQESLKKTEEKAVVSNKPAVTMEDDDDVDILELENTPPKSDWRPPPEVPSESHGNGVNKKVYFVCHEPGAEWIRLPFVTPAQIAAARKTRKFLTGNLDAEVISYPPFPGVEKNYLRVQISRISAGTQVSPQNYYQFNEEEEEDEEEGGVRDHFIENPEFEGVPLSELVESSLSNWVHHVLHILPQGRTTWWNPALAKRQGAGGEENSEEGEEEEEEQPDEPEPETGPPLLTPLSEDVEVDNMAPWTARLSSKLVPHYAVAVISSNLWPGAHAFALEKTFENIYIGWGVKYAAENYSPMAPASIMQEFPSGPETTEVEDPTPEEEAAFRAAQAEAAEANEPEEGEEEAEEEEEEDD